MAFVVSALYFLYISPRWLCSQRFLYPEIEVEEIQTGYVNIEKQDRSKREQNGLLTENLIPFSVSEICHKGMRLFLIKFPLRKYQF